jgi:sugar lactone lactonase YvrE
MRRAWGVAALLLATAASAQSSWWTAAPVELQDGDADGVAVGSRGRLFLAPRLGPVARPVGAGNPAQAWAAVADAAGNVYLGTGPDGKIVRVNPSGQQSVVFTTREPLVTALALLPSGELLAGTAPEGRIYRIGPDGRGTVWCETKARYVWSIVVGKDGSVFAGTGEQGIVYRIDRTGTPTPFFDGDDAHVVALAALPDGGLLAGGAGRGLVYRINADGKGRVVHDDDLPEARGVLAEPDGSIVAAFVAPPEPDRRPPAVRIQVAGGNAATGGGVEGVEIDERSGGTMLQGVIEGLPSDAQESSARTRGRVVRIAPDGTVTELWKSITDVPYALASDPAGRPVLGVGEPARLIRLEPDGESSLLATLPEGQVTAFVRGERALVAATSNPASVYRLERDAVDSGTFTSRPVDAGGIATWGTLRYGVDGDAGRVEFSTRTGNTAEPDATWSSWSTPLTDPKGSRVASPEGRFLQWRVRMFGGAGGGVARAAVSYETANRAPVLRDFRLEPSIRATSGKAAFRWSAFDADGDPVAVDVQVRRSGSAAWTSAVRVEPPAPKPGEPVPEVDPAWKDGRASWDVATTEEGTYDVRAVASDRASNPSASGRDVTVDLSSSLVVDRTPPDLRPRRVGGTLEVAVEDAGSAIVRFEVLSEGKVLFAPRPVDGVLDGTSETFRLSAEEAVAPRMLRAVDAAGNIIESPVPGP